ncbi:MAG: TadE/TadG family type IV pilus assembly protein [Candidatus Binataceae bacterium]
MNRRGPGIDSVRISGGRAASFGPRGQGSTEFAMIAPLLLILLFGIIQFGSLFYDYCLVSYAAGNAARWAMVHSSTSGNSGTSDTTLNGYVDGMMAGLDTSKVTVTSTPAWTTAQAPGNRVSIQISYTYTFPFKLSSLGSINLSSTAQTIITN